MLDRDVPLLSGPFWATPIALATIDGGCAAVPTARVHLFRLLLDSAHPSLGKLIWRDRPGMGMEEWLPGRLPGR